MKYIYKLSFLLISTVLLFSSCAVNDDEAIIANTVTTVVAKTKSNLERVEVAETSYNAVISFSQPVTSLARLTYTLDGEEMFVDAPQGSSNVAISVDLSNADVFVRTLKLIDLKIINAGIDSVKPEISEEFNEMKIIKGVNTVVFTFTWGDDSDLDCGTITRVPLAAVDISDTTETPEVAVLPDNAADGEYFFAILPWTVNNDPIECYVNVLNGSTEQNFTGNLVGASPAGFFGYNTIEDFIKITKVTDPVSGQVTIDLEQVMF